MIKFHCEKCRHEHHLDTVRTFKSPADALPRHEVKALAAAIARGDCADAATSLDLIFRDEPEVREWIALGRASLRAGLAA